MPKIETLDPGLKRLILDQAWVEGLDLKAEGLDLKAEGFDLKSVALPCSRAGSEPPLLLARQVRVCFLFGTRRV